MPINVHSMPVAFLLALILELAALGKPTFASAPENHQVIAPTYSITPTQTAPNLDFDLQLLSYQFNCAVTYDMLNASVTGNTISLTFLDHDASPSSICPAIYKPYGPTFKLSGLKAGTYAVTAYRLPACAAQGCKMAAMPSDAGNLVVGTTPERAGWFLKDKSVAPNQDFSMQVLNTLYGNCQTSFTHPSIDIQNGEIWVSFLIESHPERMCIADIHPYGPSFDLKGLSPGSYPVRIMERLACEFSSPRCLPPIAIPEPADTLFVSNGTAISHPNISSATRLSSTMPVAFFQSGRLQLSLPHELTGEWQGEIRTLKGRTLKTFRFSVEPNRTISIPTETQIKTGSYLLHLAGPAGESLSLPIVNKD